MNNQVSYLVTELGVHWLWRLCLQQNKNTGSGGINTSALNRLCEELVSQPRFANSSVTLTACSASLDIDTFGMTKLTSTVFDFLFWPSMSEI